MDFVTGDTDLGGMQIALEVVDIDTLIAAGFVVIEVESKQSDSLTVLVKAPTGLTKKHLDDDNNIPYYSLPKYVNKREDVL